MPDGPKQEARDELFLSQLGKELTGTFPSRWTCPKVQPWLYGYNAYEEVTKALADDPFASDDVALKEKVNDTRSVGWVGCVTSRIRAWFQALLGGR